MEYHVYIMAAGRDGALHAGVTRDLIRRVWQHKNRELPGFASPHAIESLVWFEPNPDIEAAIARERQIRSWGRQWKVALIEKGNPHWRDLYDDLLGGPADGATPQPSSAALK